MKAISLWQPWASLIACGAKPYETRSWAPPRSMIGQPIAIHAAKKVDRDAAAFATDIAYGQHQVGGFELADKLEASYRGAPDDLMQKFILAGADMEKIALWSAEPALLPKCPMKKHRGELWAQVPLDYLQWCVRDAKDIDDDVRWNVQHEIDRRRAVRRNEYVRLALTDITACVNRENLDAWWRHGADERAELGIVRGHPDYEALVHACAERVKAFAPQSEAPAQ